MILEAMNGKGPSSPWFKDECEFAQEFELANEYRAIRDRDDFEHELAPSVLKYLTEKYNWEPDPISRIHGEKLAMYAKRYIKWCEETGVLAVQGNPLWVAAFLDELREEGFSDLPTMHEAISRAHYSLGHADPTHHPLVYRVLENLRRQPKKEIEEMYDDKNKQGIIKNGEKLPTRKELDVDPPSKTGFWDKDNATASGQQDIPGDNPNFSNPHGGKSRGC